jgi:hypothetical protein
LLLLLPALGGAQEDYPTAARMHQEGRWSAAYGRFIAAGQRGDPAAAEAALFMHRFGALLYRTPWDMSTDEQHDLHRAAARRASKGTSPAAGAERQRTPVRSAKP